MNCRGYLASHHFISFSMFYLPLVFILGFTYALTVDNCNAGAFLEMLTDDENTVSMPQIPVPC